MPATTANGIRFSGQLNVALGTSNLSNHFANLIAAANPQPPHAGCYIRQRPAKHGLPQHQVLWLISPEIQFTATVTAVTNGNVNNWRAGVIQTISSLTRTALYTGNVRRELRIDTSYGPVKDGQNADIVYAGSDQFVASAPNTFTANVSETDSPNWDMPLSYTGDPQNPLGPALQQSLVGTDGHDDFSTVLAVIDDTTHSIVTLGRCTWSVDWHGQFNQHNNIWTPRDPNAILDHHEVHLAASYMNLTAQSYANLPFSLFLDEAESAFQIKVGAQWQGCSPSGNIDGRQMQLARWV